MRHAFPHHRPPGANLLLRDDFETAVNIGGGSSVVGPYNAAVLSIDTTEFRTGSSSLKVVGPNTAATYGVIIRNSDPYAGGTYKAYSWVKAPLGVGFTIAARIVIGGVYLGENQASVPFAGTGAWQYIETTTWSLAQVATMGFQIRSVPNAAFTMWVDDVGLVRTVS